MFGRLGRGRGGARTRHDPALAPAQPSLRSKLNQSQRVEPVHIPVIGTVDWKARFQTARAGHAADSALKILDSPKEFYGTESVVRHD